MCTAFLPSNSAITPMEREDGLEDIFHIISIQGIEAQCGRFLLPLQGTNDVYSVTGLTYADRFLLKEVPSNKHASHMYS